MLSNNEARKWRRHFDGRIYRPAHDDVSKISARFYAASEKKQGYHTRITRETYRDGRGKKYKVWMVWVS